MTWYLPFKISIAKTDVFVIECLDQLQADSDKVPAIVPYPGVLQWPLAAMYLQ